MTAKLHNEVYLHFSKIILDAIKKAYPETLITLEEVYALIGVAPKLELGHFSFPCFLLAKVAKTSPAAIAKELAAAISEDFLIKEVKPVGPYLNFFVATSGIARFSIESILNGKLFSQKIIDSKNKMMIEYSQPNTHKILHVGHMRNLCLGNALVRMNRYAGEEVIAVTYPGDVGTHVAKCLWFLKYHNLEEAPTNNKGAWLGKIYTSANEKLETEKGTDKEDGNRKQLTEILKELHSQSGEHYQKWLETKKWSVELMQEAYSWADVEFDRWFWESEVDAPSLTYVQKLYKEGHLIKDEGAIGMDLSEDKLGFCLLIKSDGTGLYSTKDVELARVKFNEFGVKRNIYVVDNRQAYHFQQVFKVLEKIGFKQADDCLHLQYAMVELPDGAMSSRKGNIIPLIDLVTQMEEKIKKDYLLKYLSEPETSWTQKEVNKTAQMLANGAIKYGMVKVDNNRKIVFDINEWLKLDGDTGPYLQYVHARIFSLCEKLGPVEKENNWNALVKPQEVALIIKLSYFNTIVEQSALQLKTIHLCSYLYELGKLFNSFYAECPIGKADNQETKKARLALASATGLVIKKGLEILGIPAPNRM